MRSNQDILYWVMEEKGHVEEMLSRSVNKYDCCLHTKQELLAGLQKYIEDNFVITELLTEAELKDTHTLAKFKKLAEQGYVTDYDGYGIYCTDAGYKTDNYVDMSAVGRKVPPHITKVLWVNK